MKTYYLFNKLHYGILQTSEPIEEIQSRVQDDVRVQSWVSPQNIQQDAKIKGLEYVGFDMLYK